MMWLLGRCLRLADENGRLRVENARLKRSLAMAYETVRKRTDERDLARRDLDLVCLMAKDPRTAAEFVVSAHNLKRLPEVDG